jgi:phosphotransferase system HPr (HPr) family protein
MPEITLTIKNKVGLHARPAALFVREASRFKSAITVQNGEKQANAKSILNIIALEANPGSVIRVRAEGDDAEDALNALSTLNDSNYGE